MEVWSNLFSWIWDKYSVEVFLKNRMNTSERKWMMFYNSKLLLIVVLLNFQYFVALDKLSDVFSSGIEKKTNQFNLLEIRLFWIESDVLYSVAENKIKFKSITPKKHHETLFYGHFHESLPTGRISSLGWVRVPTKLIYSIFSKTNYQH